MFGIKRIVSDKDWNISNQQLFTWYSEIYPTTILLEKFLLLWANVWNWQYCEYEIILTSRKKPACKLTWILFYSEIYPTIFICENLSNPCAILQWLWHTDDADLTDLHRFFLTIQISFTHRKPKWKRLVSEVELERPDTR